MPIFLRDELERKGSIFQTTADSEIILHLLARPADNGASVLAALRRIEGAFSLLIMSERELIAVRDPFGWRPLSLGKLDGAYILASETCAFDLIHAEFIREVEPGEVLIIDENGLRSERPFPDERPAFCMFEYVYFSRPDSMLGGVNVGKVRMEMGRELARRFPVEADIVVPVPDSGKLRRAWFCRGTKDSLCTRFCPQSLHWPHVFAAEPTHSRFRRPGETEPDQGNGRRKTRRGCR
jgi:amidophosphoribosyltransferase